MNSPTPERDTVLQLLNHIGEQEKHFNGLETQYRLLASTWLLACFGGIGFLLAGDKEFVVNPLALAGFIGLIGSVGIYLLWMMDIKVYHKLLHCVFIEGIKLEQQHDWLPRMRTEMLISQETGDVTRSTGLYYICSIAILLTVAVGSFSKYFEEMRATAFLGFMGILVFWLIFRHMSAAGANKAAGALRDTLLAERTQVQK